MEERFSVRGLGVLAYEPLFPWSLKLVLLVTKWQKGQAPAAKTLKPLNLGTIARNYQRTLRVPDETALEMARLTRGYSFAFQVLGYLTWEAKGLTEEVIDDYRQYLDDYVYDKIWSELSAGDRRLAVGIAKSKTGKVSDVRNILGMKTNQFNPYRRRLIRKGIISGDERGYVRFALPCFEDYAIEHED